MGKQCKQRQTLFFGAPKSLQMVTATMKLKHAHCLEGKLWPTLIEYSKAEILLCQQRCILSRLWFFQWSCMDVKVGLWRKLSAEELMLLNCGVGEDYWESLDCKEIQPVHPKGDQSWVFFGRTDAKAETPILGHLMWRVDSLEKILMLGGIGGRRRRGR